MGLLANLQKSFALGLVPSQFVAWIDAVSDAIDSFIPTAVPPAGQVPTSTGTAWETIGLLQGLDLPNANINLTIPAGNVRFIRANTLTANRAYTLSTTAGEVLNDVIGIVREDVGAFTASIINGGPAAGTLYVFAAAVKKVAWFQFDGVDWFELSQATITSSI